MNALSRTKMISGKNFGFRLLIACGLMVSCLGALLFVFDNNDMLIGWLLYRINPRYWPLWPSYIVWGIAAWLFVNLLSSRFQRIHASRLWLKSGIALCVVLLLESQFAWSLGWRKKLYYGLYVEFILEPFFALTTDGTFTWKLLVAPTFVICVFAALLYLNQCIKTREKNEAIPTIPPES